MSYWFDSSQMFNSSQLMPCIQILSWNIFHLVVVIYVTWQCNNHQTGAFWVLLYSHLFFVVVTATLKLHFVQKWLNTAKMFIFFCDFVVQSYKYCATFISQLIFIFKQILVLTLQTHLFSTMTQEPLISFEPLRKMFFFLWMDAVPTCWEMPVDGHARKQVSRVYRLLH